MGFYLAQSGVLVEAVAQSEADAGADAEAEIIDTLAKLIKQAHSQFAKLDYSNPSKIKDVEGMLRDRVKMLAPHGAKPSLKQQREIVRKAFAKADPEHAKKFFDAFGQYKAPKRTKRPTFQQARDAIFAYLKDQGWTIKTLGPSGRLKVPQAIAPYMRGPKLWFKTQAVYYSGKDDRFNDARSIHVDIRDITPEQFLAQVERWHRG